MVKKREKDPTYTAKVLQNNSKRCPPKPGVYSVMTILVYSYSPLSISSFINAIILLFPKAVNTFCYFANLFNHLYFYAITYGYKSLNDHLQKLNLSIIHSNPLFVILLLEKIERYVTMYHLV